MMAQNYAALRDVPDAEKEYREALRLRPQISGLHLELGEVYARAQQWDKAEEEYRAETKSSRATPKRPTAWARRWCKKANSTMRAWRFPIPII